MDIEKKNQILKWFGQNLKRARKEKDYSQESLADIAGIDMSYYGTVERGEKAITIAKLAQITSALNIPMRYLFSNEPNRPSDENEDDYEKLIQFLSESEPEDISFFYELLPKLIEWQKRNKCRN